MSDDEARSCMGGGNKKQGWAASKDWREKKKSRRRRGAAVFGDADGMGRDGPGLALPLAIEFKASRWGARG